MKTITLTCLLAITALIGVAGWNLTSTHVNAPPPQKPRLAVLPLSDETSPSSSLSIRRGNIDHRVPLVRLTRDEYGAISRSKIESALSQWDEIVLADRFQMGLILREIELNRFLKQVKAMPQWKESPITHFLLVELLSINHHSAEFDGYGIHLNETVFTVRLRIRVIEFTSKNVVYSTESTGTFAMAQSDFVRLQEENPRREAVVAALESLLGRPNFREELLAALTGGEWKAPPSQPEPTVETVVVFDASPERTTVEIDGVVVGTGKVTRRLLHGQRYDVRIFRSGFDEWKGTIQVETDMVIAPQLLPLNGRMSEGGAR